MNYYIKERNNPQFNKPYYVFYGKMSAKEAKKKESSLYGENYMMKFKTKEQYENKIIELRACKFTVIDHAQ